MNKTREFKSLQDEIDAELLKIAKLEDLIERRDAGQILSQEDFAFMWDLATEDKTGE